MRPPERVLEVVEVGSRGTSHHTADTEGSSAKAPNPGQSEAEAPKKVRAPERVLEVVKVGSRGTSHHTADAEGSSAKAPNPGQSEAEALKNTPPVNRTRTG